jgi:hypothetical protein
VLILGVPAERIRALGETLDDGGLWDDILWLALLARAATDGGERRMRWHHLVMAVGNFKRQGGQAAEALAAAGLGLVAGGENGLDLVKPGSRDPLPPALHVRDHEDDHRPGDHRPARVKIKSFLRTGCGITVWHSLMLRGQRGSLLGRPRKR